MPDLISSHRAIREIPQAGGAVVTAQFVIVDDLDLTRAQIAAAANSAMPQIRMAIRDAVGREYNRSGLRVRSGNLLRQALTRFTLKVFLRGRRLVVEAEWFPTIRYFFIHLFGGIITPRRAEWLHFKTDTGWVKTKRVVMPRRNFIRFDSTAQVQVEEALETALHAEAIRRAVAKAPGERREPAIEVRGRAVRARPGGPPVPGRPARPTRPVRPERRLTRFRVRKTLREGGFGEVQAREMEPEISAQVDVASAIAGALAARKALKRTGLLGMIFKALGRN